MQNRRLRIWLIFGLVSSLFVGAVNGLFAADKIRREGLKKAVLNIVTFSWMCVNSFISINQIRKLRSDDDCSIDFEFENKPNTNG